MDQKNKLNDKIKWFKKVNTAIFISGKGVI